NSKTDYIAKTNAKTNNEENFEGYGVKETKRNIIIGSIKNSENVCFKSASKQVLIHLGKVSLNKSKEAVYAHLCKTFSRKDFNVQPCPMRYDAKSMSFKIAGEISLLDEIYKNENWTAVVSVARYKLSQVQEKRYFDKQ
ncbi:hypothetical protein HHI36_001557, partial [Cryptolaemus montrouzieri]